MPAPVLILPGFGSSGPQHWQSIWEQLHPHYARVNQRDWEHPVCDEWVATIETAVRSAGPNVVLVAHSLGCLTIAHWAAGKHSPIKGALLVAVPDVNGSSFPKDTQGYSQTPTAAFSFPSIVVVSNNDPYASVEHAEKLATSWGSRIVRIGGCGHINADSELGNWPAGQALLKELCD